MIEAICILVGLCLFVWGISVYCDTNKKGSSDVIVRPSMPSRSETAIRSASIITTGTGSRNSPAISRPLPPRHADRTISRGLATGQNRPSSGPRGIRPAQFPCCPYDKQRNIPGSRQLIFWDSGANCYRCSRGHQFKANGKPM